MIICQSYRLIEYLSSYYEPVYCLCLPRICIPQHDWGVKAGEEVEDKVALLNQLLIDFRLQPIIETVGLKY